MAEAPGLLNKSVSCYRVVSAMEKNSKEEGQWKVGVANMNRVAGEVVGERVPCAKDMKTMRGEPGRCLEENVLGNENSKVVTWLGPWAGPRKQNGAVTLIVQSLVSTLRILTFPLSERGAKMRPVLWSKWQVSLFMLNLRCLLEVWEMSRLHL